MRLLKRKLPQIQPFKAMHDNFMGAAEDIRATRHHAWQATKKTTFGLGWGFSGICAKAFSHMGRHPVISATAVLATIGIHYQDEMRDSFKRGFASAMVSLCESAPTCGEEDIMRMEVNFALNELKNG